MPEKGNHGRIINGRKCRAVGSVLDNRTLLCCMAAWVSAQLVKYLIDGLRHRGWSPVHLLFGSGGMPSSHTAFVTALATRAGMTEGFDSLSFAICFVLSFVVMTDAIGVRRETGRQGSAINILMDWFMLENHPGQENEDLKERIGHTPLEVLVGVMWGIGCALLFA